MQHYALSRGGRGHVGGNAVATWCDQLSNPTLSTSVEAALRLAAILAIGSRIGGELAVARNRRVDGDACANRVFVVGIGVDLLRLLAGEPLDQLDAVGLVGRVLGQQTPERLTWVPPPSNVGRITLVASAHGFFSGSLFIISAQ